MLRLGAASVTTLVAALGACAGDNEGDDGSDGSGAASATSTSSSGGAGGTGAATSSSQMASSSTGMMRCTKGGEPGCPCPEDVCPTALVSGLEFASSLRQSTDDLWYIASIERLPKAGGTPTKVVTELIAALAVDDAGIYWIDGTASFVKTAAHDGTATAFIANADALMHPQFVVVDDTDAYWATVAAMGAGSCVRIHRAPKIGAGMATQVAEVCDTTAPRIPYSLALDDTTVYWATVSNPALNNGKIHSSGKAGGGPVAELVTTNGPVNRIQVHGTDLYFVAGAAVNVLDLSTANAMPDKVSGQVDVSAYAVDGAELWIVGDDGLHSVDTTTEMSTMLAWEHGSEIVVDSASIYWLSDGTDGTSVLALPR